MNKIFEELLERRCLVLPWGFRFYSSKEKMHETAHCAHRVRPFPPILALALVWSQCLKVVWQARHERCPLLSGEVLQPYRISQYLM